MWAIFDFYGVSRSALFAVISSVAVVLSVDVIYFRNMLVFIALYLIRLVDIACMIKVFLVN